MRDVNAAINIKKEALSIPMGHGEFKSVESVEVLISLTLARDGTFEESESAICEKAQKAVTL